MRTVRSDYFTHEMLWNTQKKEETDKQIISSNSFKIIICLLCNLNLLRLCNVNALLNSWECLDRERLSYPPMYIFCTRKENYALKYSKFTKRKLNFIMSWKKMFSPKCFASQFCHSLMVEASFRFLQAVWSMKDVLSSTNSSHGQLFAQLHNWNFSSSLKPNGKKMENTT